MNSPGQTNSQRHQRLVELSCASIVRSFQLFTVFSPSGRRLRWPARPGCMSCDQGMQAKAGPTLCSLQASTTCILQAACRATPHPLSFCGCKGEGPRTRNKQATQRAANRAFEGPSGFCGLRAPPPALQVFTALMTSNMMITL